MNLKRILLIVISTLVFSLSLAISYIHQTILPVYFTIMMLQFYTIIKFRRNVVIFIFLTYMLTYFTPLYHHYVCDIALTPWTQNFIGIFDEKTVIINSIFYFSFFIGMIVFYKEKEYKKIHFKYTKNNIIYFLCILGIIAGILLGHTGELQIGNYGRGEASSTIFNEYIIIFFLLAHIFTNDEKNKKNLIFILYAIFTVVNFLYGDRIAVLQVGILIFIINFSEKINWKKALLIMSLVFLSLNLVDNLRQTGSFIRDTNNKIVTNINTNQTQVFNSTVTYVRLVDEKVVNSSQRLESFLAYTARMISGETWTELDNLSKYTRPIFRQQGGGFVAGYFYFWFGIIGVIFSGLLVSKIITLTFTYNHKKQGTLVFLILVISMFPRWLVYDPISMIKLPFYGFLVYYLFVFLKNITSRKKLHKS